MKENRLKDIGITISQIGFYLSSMDETLFQDTELNRNLVSFMVNASLLLNDIMKNKNNICKQSIEEKKVIQYLSKKEVIKNYHPLITEYALSQAISKGQITYSKRGAKYYFEDKDIEEWINNQKSKNNLQRNAIKYV